MRDISELTRIDRVGGVPIYAEDYDVTLNDELRNLVDELREDVSDAREEAWEDAGNTLERASSLTKAEGIEHAADELEALVDDE